MPKEKDWLKGRLVVKTTFDHFQLDFKPNEACEYSHGEQKLSIHKFIFVKNIILLVQMLAMSLAHIQT